MSENKFPEYISSIDDFRRQLKKQKNSYILANELPAEKVYLQFEGNLDDKEVVWNACIRTIEEYSRKYNVLDDPKQFIDIKVNKCVYKLEVALNIAQIDQAVIERTIIMIRKYKRLRLGRHEYGARSKTD